MIAQKCQEKVGISLKRLSMHIVRVKSGRGYNIQKLCPVCDKAFWSHECLKQVYCSRKCVYRGIIVKPNSGQFKKGNKPWHAGKPLPKYYKKSLSNAKLKNPVRYWLGKKRLSLRKNNNTRNMRQREMGRLEYVQWRKKVFKRDNYTCQMCEEYAGALNAHHIKAWKKYPKLRYKTNNGITLCVKCHKIVHKKVLKLYKEAK